MWFYLIGFMFLCIPVLGELLFLVKNRITHCLTRKMRRHTVVPDLYTEGTEDIRRGRNYETIP
jgi:hypothetical protein